MAPAPTASGRDRDLVGEFSHTGYPRPAEAPRLEAALKWREPPEPPSASHHRAPDPPSAPSSPLGSGRLVVPFLQAVAIGGPRKHSIRRRIAANTARGTAASASWKTM